MAGENEQPLRQDDYHYELEQGEEKFDVETSTYSSAVESQNYSNSSTIYGNSIVEKTDEGLDSTGPGSFASTPAPSVLGIPSIVRSKSSTRGEGGALGILRKMSGLKDNRSQSQSRQGAAGSKGAAAEGPTVKGPGGPPKEVFPETDLSKNLVGWEGQDDPLHPRNFPSKKKWLMLACVSLITFLRYTNSPKHWSYNPLSSSIVAPGITLMNAEFKNTSSILSTFVVSIFVLGFAVGPLVLSPLSEIYGRRPILLYCNFFLTVWQAGCALAPNIHLMILFRFFAGLGGSACLAVGGGVVADLFPIQERGKAQAMFVMGPLFGPVLGPVIGGFIAQRAGWRWTYWVLLAACGVLSIFYVIVGKESSAHVIVRKKTIALCTETGNPDFISAYDAKKPPAALKLKAVIFTGIARPFRMMFSSPILPMLGLWMSFVFGLVYLLLTSIAEVFESTYGFSIEIASLAYLGLGLGFFLGMFTVAKTSDPTIISLTNKNDGVYQPEFRLRNGLFFAFFIPGSFFWYGWSTYYRVHWIVPMLGLVPFGFGTMGVFAGIQTYYIDTGKQYAASAMAGLTAIRCLFAAFMPLAGPSLYANLGLGWGNSVLGFIGLALFPAPFFIFKYGAKLRERYPVRVD
ncbi:MFS multidrug transporter protein [Rutstroemia sp. NJR-2017a WRK4]|nr:MFS multidrug transporter protein [Rutstroemia sp. NJR-2017a WRK4]